MTQAELELFMGHEAALPLYAELRARLFERWPETELRVSRTQISFRARYGFAFVSTRRMGRRCPEVFIVLSLGLGRELKSGRVLAASEPYPGRWTHHIIISSPEEIDAELLAWLAEAREFALTK